MQETEEPESFESTVIQERNKAMDEIVKKSKKHSKRDKTLLEIHRKKLKKEKKKVSVLEIINVSVLGGDQIFFERILTSFLVKEGSISWFFKVLYFSVLRQGVCLAI